MALRRRAGQRALREVWSRPERSARADPFSKSVPSITEMSGRLPRWSGTCRRSSRKSFVSHTFNCCFRSVRTARPSSSSPASNHPSDRASSSAPFARPARPVLGCLRCCISVFALSLPFLMMNAAHSTTCWHVQAHRDRDGSIPATASGPAFTLHECSVSGSVTATWGGKR